jgi:alkanesulfonate monooxygenase SsuD/methylene tetrahydromethanopterin reductase-like flavin-dependent oxidoreductase (luciferase family)
MQISQGALRFGIHAGQQHASFGEYLALWRLAGRDPGDIRKQVVLRAILDDSEAAAADRLREAADRAGVAPEQLGEGMVVGTPEQCAERLRAHRDWASATSCCSPGRPPTAARSSCSRARWRLALRA